MLFPPGPIELEKDFWLLPGLAAALPLLAEIESVVALAPLRHLIVPGGKRMAVAMSNCGPLGWTSDSSGYRYSPVDPLTQKPWPAMPALFQTLARSAALSAGWPDFSPDACLINQYGPLAGLGLHQDRDELDHSQPIVSVSIGLSCKFIIGGLERKSSVRSMALHHGDVMVWGGASRLRFHGVYPLPKQHGPIPQYRHNLTFRKAI
jgi:DNA oxidative demethylase